MVSERYLPMYFRLAFWTLSLAYLAVLFSNSTPGSSPGTVITAVVFGAILGWGGNGCLHSDVGQQAEAVQNG